MGSLRAPGVFGNTRSMPCGGPVLPLALILTCYRCYKNLPLKAPCGGRSGRGVVGGCSTAVHPLTLSLSRKGRGDPQAQSRGKAYLDTNAPQSCPSPIAERAGVGVVVEEADCGLICR